MSTSYRGEATAFPDAGIRVFEYPDFACADAQRTADTPGQTVEPACKHNEEELAAKLRQAREEGYRQGEAAVRASVAAEIDKTRERISHALRVFEQERNEYYARIESEVVSLALSIAAKILHREAQVDPMLVAGLVRVTLEAFNKNTKATARVCAAEVSAWRSYFERHGITNVTVAEDVRLAAGDCQLETELGTTDIGVHAQLQEIERGLFDLLSHRPERAK